MTGIPITERALVATSISKTYGRSTVLKGIDLELEYGRIHALLGSNGSGKSTMVKFLTGVHVADPGWSLTVHGERMGSPWDVQHARAAGILSLHQDAPLSGGLTVMELAGIRSGFPTRGGFIRWGALRRRAQSALDALGIRIDARRRADSLRPSQRVSVGLAMLLAENTGERPIIILDEPTSPLSDAESAQFLTYARNAADLGAAVLLVTHRLAEVEQFCDEVTVLRNGESALRGPTARIGVEDIVTAMSDTETTRDAATTASLSPIVADYLEQSPPTPTIVLESTRAGDLVDLSLTLEPGEIVGVVADSDVEASQLGMLLAGRLPVSEGTIRVEGERPLTGREATTALREQAAFLPAERLRDSAIESLSVRQNIGLPRYDRYWARPKIEQRDLTAVYDMLDIRPRIPARTLGSLSGGNQQKAVVGKWLLSGRRVYVLDNPTVGVDPIAREHIYTVLRQLVERGCSAVVLSNDAGQIAGIAQRVLVLSNGRIVTELRGDEVTEETIRTATVTATTIGTAGASS